MKGKREKINVKLEDGSTMIYDSINNTLEKTVKLIVK